MEKKLLLVDDEEGIRKVLGITLMDMGYEVQTAENGEKALQIFHEFHPPIVLTDIKMPGMDGIELLRAIKKERQETEVIMITGHGDLDLAIKSIKLDATDFVTKPINQEVLEIALNRAEERYSLREEIREHTENLERLVEEKASKLVEAERRSAKRFQQLIDEAPCYITVQDKEFKLVASNKRFRRDFGDELGAPCYKIYKHREAPCSDCPVVKTFDDGEQHQQETVVTAKSGEQYNVLCWTAPLHDENGEVTQVMELSTDISQIRKLQDHLTSLGIMIGSMSHGVKGMLTALDGGMYRLESGMKKGDQKRIEDAFSVVKQMVERIKSMVLDILYYAKSRELDWKTIDAAAFASDVASLVEPKAEKFNVGFKTKIDNDLGEFEADETKLSAALVNFLENAVDACAEDSAKDNHSVTFRAYNDNGAVVFDIEDNGMGMDQETREKIFTLFFSSKGSKGTGLGLFVSNQVVEQHGGSIKVVSEQGNGSKFHVRLPRVIPRDIKQAQETTQA